MRRCRRNFRVVVVCALTSVTFFASPIVTNYARAGSATGRILFEPGTAAFFAEQDHLETMGRRAEAMSGTDEYFSSVAVDAARDTLTVFRTRGHSAATKSEEARYSSLGTTGVVEFATALLTAAQVKDLDTITYAELRHAKAEGTSIQSWGLQASAGPYDIAYTGRAPSARLVTALAKYGTHSIVFRRSTTIALGRFDDTSPFYGGARLIGPAPVRDNCTGGFGTYSNINGAHYLTVAWHCYNKSNANYYTPQGRLIGPITAIDLPNDTAFIKTTQVGNSTGPYIFEGGQGDDYAKKQVVGVGGFMTGLAVCISGSVTKAICTTKMQIARHWAVENDYNASDTADVSGYTVNSTNNGVIVTQGDSGGPVFSNANGNTQATARGAVSAGDNGFRKTCPAYIVSQMGSGAQCFSQALVVNMQAVANAHNLDFTR